MNAECYSTASIPLLRGVVMPVPVAEGSKGVERE